ncbi:TraR/DksA C4-type zinc finger protein [Variovorax sp. PAMC28562]|uniref:TraR/DksA family transcriptional regulator n=1 Tax=Variovorax sp. PAMC28562 TaxID=2762323 RepID=UPI00164E8F57|nr:TraR/DksA C4-type zinc finger protein [Variovorax sp. PAMC28562]QNK73252.1 TraR/DksA C4-type zinc finger protein [Variovorax sp. PAMC28562]
MSHMSAEDMRAFVERLDILRRWAVAHDRRKLAAQLDHENDAPHADDAKTAVKTAACAAVKVRRPTLADIEQALQRISIGRYALCVDCEQVIARERLLIQPAAVRCVACQSAPSTIAR